MAKKKDSTQKGQALTDLLRREGIHNEAILKAIETVPRELFVKATDIEEAYINAPLSIKCGQTISQPYIIAQMTQLLFSVPQMEKVLEIGTGSGYQAAILGLLAKDVFTIERHETLYVEAKDILAKLGFTNIHCRFADGFLGWKEEVPFDGIIITAAPSEVPYNLLMQLRDGGRMVVPVGAKFNQELQVIDRQGDKFKVSSIEGVRFVPMLPGVEE